MSQTNQAPLQCAPVVNELPGSVAAVSRGGASRGMNLIDLSGVNLNFQFLNFFTPFGV